MAPPALDVLIDLDDTLAYDHRTGKPEFENICTLNYSLFLGGREFLAVLHQLGARITFHSQGSSARNSKLVSAIAAKYFKEGTLDYRLFSGDHESVKRKRLGGLFDGINVDSAVMVDDLSHLFALKGEERNFLQVIPNLVRDADKDVHVKRHYQVVCSNRLVRALGMILWALHLSRTTRLTPVEALSAMQWHGSSGSGSSGRYQHSRTHSRPVYELGLKAMRRVNPGIEMQLVSSDAVAPWTFPFEQQALGDNKFEPEQVDAIAEKLPRLTKQEQDMLTPPLGFDPQALFCECEH